MNKEKLNVYTIIAFSLIFGILTDYLFYGKMIGVSFFIFILAIIAFSLVVAKRFEQKLSRNQILIVISIIIMSAGVFLRSSSFLTFFNTTGSIYLLFLTAVLFADNIFSDSRLLRYLSAPMIFFLESIGNSVKYINQHKTLISPMRNSAQKNFEA